MSDETLQFGHPDADQLNALMENALPAAERERTLAHLAMCADCRMVFALAAGADELEAQPAVVERPRRWVPAWVWGLPAVVALAFITVRRSAPVVAPVAAPTQQAELKTPAPPVAPVLAAPQQALVAPPKAVVQNQLKTLPLAERSAVIAVPPKVPAAVASPQGGLMDGIAAADAPQAAPKAAFAPLVQAAPPLMLQAVPAPMTRNAAALGQARSSAPPAPAKAPVPVQMGNGSATVLTGEALSALSDDSAASFARAASPARLRAMAKPAAPSVVAHPLPSGFAVMSSTTALGETLALDSGSHLFMTRDGGEHWAAVEANWKGKAIQVGLVGSRQAIVSVDQDSNASATVLRGAEIASSVTGTVKDPTGAVIPGAAVTLKRSDGLMVRTAKTDAQGRYAIAGVAPGNFSLSATMPGFAEQMAAVTVPAMTQFNQDLTLRLGSASETVDVTAANADLQIENATLDTRAKTLKKRKAEVVPAPVFELETEKGVRWVSGDGVKWVKK